MSDEEGGYELLVAFPDGSPSFVYGFQAGQVWEAMRRSDPTIEHTAPAENEEVLRRMARSQGYELEWRVSEIPEWAYATFRKNRPAGGADPITTGRMTVLDGGRK